jgi:hypothetical protein
MSDFSSIDAAITGQTRNLGNTSTTPTTTPTPTPTVTPSADAGLMALGFDGKNYIRLAVRDEKDNAILVEALKRYL